MESSEEHWIVRVKNQDYPAGDRNMLLEWFHDGRVSIDSEIYNPQTHKWLSYSDFMQEVASGVILTTTPSIEGFQIKRYIDIESVEFVIGIGAWNEFTGEWASFFGKRAGTFEKKLQVAKQGVLNSLRVIAVQRGGNAVVGLDLDYTQFSEDRIAVIANGTVVLVHPNQAP